jgi:hypothetical protein
MSVRPPVSVLLPTTEWTASCEDLLAGLREGDELLILGDAETDPVVDREPPAPVEVLVVGEPEGCSGKANALAAGMERATNDRFVWTDADVPRDDEWLDRLVAAGERHGPATAVPFFYGDGWWRLLEPLFGVLFSLLFYYGVGELGNVVWGGGVTFTRSELTVDVPTFAAELRTVLSDDALLSERLADVHIVRSMVAPVAVPGDLSTVVDRTVRFARIAHLAEGLHGHLLAHSLLVAVGLSFPLVVAPVVTALAALAYLRLGVRRWTFLLAFPGLFLLPVVTAAGIARTEFEWAGRRYRYLDSDRVEVVDGRSAAERTSGRDE